MKNLPINIKVILVIILILLIGSCTKTVYNSTVGLYNTTKQLEADYTKVCQEQISNYDGYYLAFIDKQANTTINKESFIQVTDIIMSARKDGQSVSWKWLQENQQIPYSEFTIFYKELSEFINIRYADNMKIESNKQSIVQEHNLLLAKYPNNIINRILEIDKLVYKQGYISDYTKLKFK